MKGGQYNRIGHQVGDRAHVLIDEKSSPSKGKADALSHGHTKIKHPNESHPPEPSSWKLRSVVGGERRRKRKTFFLAHFQPVQEKQFQHVKFFLQR